MIEQIWDRIFPTRKEYMDLLKRVEHLENEAADLMESDEKVKAKRVVIKAGGTRDDLTLIKGVGEVNQEKLNSAGITRLEQIARLTEIQAEELEEKLEIFPGRILREDWIGQARELTGMQTQK